MAVMRRQQAFCLNAERTGACQGVRGEQRTGIVFTTVDAVGVAGNCPGRVPRKASAKASKYSLLRPPRPCRGRSATVVSPPEIKASGPLARRAWASAACCRATVWASPPTLSEISSAGMPCCSNSPTAAIRLSCARPMTRFSMREKHGSPGLGVSLRVPAEQASRWR